MEITNHRASDHKKILLTLNSGGMNLYSGGSIWE